MADDDVPRSKKGFIAIDLDGTTLIQKFDKNKWFGVTHNRSDLRESLIKLIKIAQFNGYDVVIVTARPTFVETFILNPGKNWLGTKSTDEILSLLDERGIKIKEVYRVESRGIKEGLKGKSMQMILQKYRDNGATEAVGILFDDQLKQIKDVRAIGEPNLIAFDINSVKDAKKIRDRIMPNLSENSVSNINEAHGTLNEIHRLLTIPNTLDKSIYSQESYIIDKISHDLALRLEEARHGEYQPEIDWVKNAVNGINLLTKKLAFNQTISYEDITQASKKIFGSANYTAVMPSTKCERTIRNFLVYMTRLPIKEDLKTRCEEYKVHLENELISNKFFLEPSEQIQRKLNVIDRLLTTLQVNNPTHALEQFQKLFQDNEAILKTSGNNNNFVNTIRSLLSKIPLLGDLFKYEDEKLTEVICKTNSAYSYTKHHIRELAEINSFSP